MSLRRWDSSAPTCSSRTSSNTAPQRATAAPVSLAWLLARSPDMLPIPGTSKVEHLEENLGAARVQLTQAQVEELTAAA
jgi:pyridoxine 4-dehydrogenase